jgi:precorrin-8X/cobalt-precorrin-8 methylmutase
MRGAVTSRDFQQMQGDAVPGQPAGAVDEECLALRARIDLSGLAPLTRTVTERVIGSSGDLCYASDLVCSERWLEAAVGALAAGAPVVADGPMVAAGIFAESLICKVGQSLTERLARTAGIAPAAAAVRLAFGEAGAGAVWVVGTEPAAIGEILSRDVQPALVIAMPAGFVAAVAAKHALRDSGLPSLTNVGEKGGPAVAAAACGPLLVAARAAAAARAANQDDAVRRRRAAPPGEPVRTR